MAWGITWEDECLENLKEIYGTQEMADAAIAAMDWRLEREPRGRGTWLLAPGKSSVRLTLVRPYLEFPAVALSYRLDEDDPRGPQCVMEKARRANVAGAS